jgi:hypothetical protein
VRRHLVVLVLLTHPELDALATREPGNVDEMFASTAAQEMLDHRGSRACWWWKLLQPKSARPPSAATSK